MSADDVAPTTFPLQVAGYNEDADQGLAPAIAVMPEERHRNSTADLGIESTTSFGTSTGKDISRPYWNWGLELLEQSPTASFRWLEFENIPADFPSGADGTGAAVVADGLDQAAAFPDGFTASELDQSVAPDSLRLRSASRNAPNTSSATAEEWDISAGDHTSQDLLPWSTAMYTNNPEQGHAAARFNALASVDESLLNTVGREQFPVSSSASDTSTQLPTTISSTASSTATPTSADAQFSRSESTPLTSDTTSSSVKTSLRSPGLQRILPIISSYPKLLLDEEYKSPFIHHKLYRGPPSDMTLMTKSNMAICCASAHGNKGSAQYITKAIAAERERLVHDFHHYSCMDEWDALHAMCIYQILELLCTSDETAGKPKLTAAQLHIPFLLKMTRRFAKNHAGGKNFPTTKEADWLQWLVAETVRRTIFLANIINVLASCENTAISHYFEPLDDDLILDMALPAPNALWEARTAESWKAMRETLAGEEGNERTLRGVLGGARMQSDKEAEMDKIGLADSAQLANLVIVCATAQYSD